MVKIKNYWEGLDSLKDLVENLSNHYKTTPTMSIDKIQANHEIYYMISSFIDNPNHEKLNKVNIDQIQSELIKFKHRLNEIADDFYALAFSMDEFSEKLKIEKNNIDIDSNSEEISTENSNPENSTHKNTEDIKKLISKSILNNNSSTIKKIKETAINSNNPIKTDDLNRKISPLNHTQQSNDQIFINLLLNQKKSGKVFSFTTNNMIYLNDKYKLELKEIIKILHKSSSLKIIEARDINTHKVILKIHNMPTIEHQKYILSLKKFGIHLDIDYL